MVNSHAVIAATDDDFDSLIDSTDGTVLVEFWAPWCTSCRQVEPLVEAAARDHESLLVLTVDVDANPEVQRRCRIMSLPTAVMFRSGEEVGRTSGLVNVRTMLSELAQRHSTTSESVSGNCSSQIAR